jgi:tetratricopeptide (TPR) repeat protein
MQTGSLAADLMAEAAAHYQHGRPREAVKSYLATLEADPGNLEAYSNLALIHVQTGRLAEAESCWRSIVRLAPDLPAAHNNLGATLRSLGRPAEAVEAFRTALRLNGAYAEASNNLGAALCELARFEEAVPHYMDAIRAMPNYPKALCNLGSALRDLRRFDEALECLSHALRIAPDFAEAHVVAAELLLLTGRLEPGWREFEWRMFLPRAGRRNFLAPGWRGGATGGKTILIHAEEGLGDTIQFCRFIPKLAAAGHRIVLEVQAPLLRLCAQLPGAEAVSAAGGALPPHDLQCPLLSVPLVLGTRADTIPAEIPYLEANPYAVARWRGRLASLPGRTVGLAWAGNPEYPADMRRSIPLHRLAPLAAAQRTSFVSLQKGDAARAPAPPGMVLHDWTDELVDMAETAALISALDLVVSVDTSIAHLAGALGKPVWLLNRFDTDWRWQLDRQDSDWYPTMRIFRQPRPGDWEAPLAIIRDGLDSEDWTAPAVSRKTAPPIAGEHETWEQATTLDRLAARAMQQGDFEAALSHSTEAVRLRPEASWLHNNLANAWRALARLPEALAAYEEAFRLSGDLVTRCNMAHLLRDLGEVEEAEAVYREVISASPELAEAHVGLGGLLLETCRFKEGWERFSWRTRTTTFRQRPFAQPAWDGRPAPGKVVLIHSDEGLGDAIQFSRYVERASSLAEIVLEAPPPLAPLFASLSGPARTIVLGEPPGPFDLRCALLDLPGLFGTDLTNIPGAVPYLRADPAGCRRWRDRVAELGGLRVGLVWSGNPSNPADRVRSIAPGLLQPLLSLAGGCSFVSLQKDNDRVGMQIPGSDGLVCDWTEELSDMGETAALIENLHLVIGVDTAVVHLAGALGKPVWLLNRWSTDWRWMHSRSDSPWYPTMRIFRQSNLGDWQPVIDAVVSELSMLCRSSGA